MPKIHRLTITDYQYNNLCDTYGCNNRAKHSLGREGYPKRAAHNVCDACLKDIAMQVPIEMILIRDDLQEYIDAQIKKGTEAARELMGIDKAINTEPVEDMTTLNPDIPPIDDDGPSGKWVTIINEITPEERLNGDLLPIGQCTYKFVPDEDIPTDDIPFSEDFEAELIDSYSYKELQDIAKDLSLPYVGIKTQDLKDSILIALKEDR